MKNKFNLNLGDIIFILFTLALILVIQNIDSAQSQENWLLISLIILLYLLIRKRSFLSTTQNIKVIFKETNPITFSKGRWFVFLGTLNVIISILYLPVILITPFALFVGFTWSGGGEISVAAWNGVWMIGLTFFSYPILWLMTIRIAFDKRYTLFSNRFKYTVMFLPFVLILIFEAGVYLIIGQSIFSSLFSLKF